MLGGVFLLVVVATVILGAFLPYIARQDRDR